MSGKCLTQYAFPVLVISIKFRKCKQFGIRIQGELGPYSTAILSKYLDLRYLISK